MATYKVYGYDSTNIVPIIPTSSDDLNVPGNIVVDGNMTVSGTTTTVDTEIAVADKFIHVNALYAAEAATEAGIIFSLDPEFSTKIQGSSANVVFVANAAASATITIGAGTTAPSAAVGQKITLIDKAATSKTYVIVDKPNSTDQSTSAQMNTGAIIAETDVIGSGVTIGSGDALIGGIALAIDRAGGNQHDILEALKSAVEGSTGHNGTLTGTLSSGTATGGADNIVFLNTAKGSAGNTSITEDIADITGTPAFSGGSNTQIKQVSSNFSSNFAQHDLIQITNAEDSANNGLYEIQAHNYTGGTTNELDLKDVDVFATSTQFGPFLNTSVTANAADSTVVIQVVKVGILKTNSAANGFEVGFASSSNGLTMTSLLTTASSITASAIAADDITAGDAAVNLTTSTGNITIDAAANNSDIIFKGTDATADITMLTLQGANAGKAVFNNDIACVNIEMTGNLQLPDNGTIGVSGDTDAIQIASSGKVTIGGSDGGADLAITSDTELSVGKGVGYEFTANEAIDVGEVVYFGSNGKVALADADAVSTSAVIAIALESGGADDDILCNTMYGAIVDIKLVSTETFNRGVAIYLDETAGRGTATAPSASGDVVLRLGYAYEAGNGSLTEVKVIYAPEFIANV